VTARHPDSPGDEQADELTDVTQARQEDLGHPHLDEELDREELSDRTPPGQNSDWMPQ
jgi:hypothetical protein